MTSSTRRNGPRVQALLHESFVEIGRSGRRWTRGEIVGLLAEEDDQVVPEVSEWAFVDLSPELVLVTYLVRGARFESRHSSVWDVGGQALQMRFHQGTVVPDGGSSHG